MNIIFAKEDFDVIDKRRHYKTIFASDESFQNVIYILGNDKLNKPVKTNVVCLDNESYNVKWITPDAEAHLASKALGTPIDFSTYKHSKNINEFIVDLDFSKNFNQMARHFTVDLKGTISFGSSKYQLFYHSFDRAESFKSKAKDIFNQLSKITVFNDSSLLSRPYIYLDADTSIDIIGTPISPRFEMTHKDKTIVYQKDKEELFTILRHYNENYNVNNSKLEPVS